MKKWYAVYTRARCEKKVSALLTKKKIENYCPLNRVARTGQYDYRNGILEPLFPNFVFVHITENQLEQVRALNDVVNYVYWLGRPAQIRELEIENIREFMDEYEHAELEKMPVNASAMVRIVSSLGHTGEESLVTLKNNRVKLMLPSLGYALSAEAAQAEVNIGMYVYKVRDKVS